MNEKDDHQCKRTTRGTHGPSSLHMQNPDLIFNELALKTGDVFIDLGCGSGDYAFIAARKIGPSGHVYAVDRQPEMMEQIGRQAESTGLDHLLPVIADLTEPLPFGNDTGDVCFVCTVLHAISNPEDRNRLFQEMFRVLKTGGRAFSIDCKKEPSSFGPPLALRVSTDEVDRYALSAGFEKAGERDLGYNLLLAYRKPPRVR